MKSVSALTLCLILMLSTSSPILAESEEPDPLQQLREEIVLLFQPGTWYDGLDVREFALGMVDLAEEEIDQTAKEAAEAAAAETTRQLKPELKGWKDRAEAAEKESRLRLILSIVTPIGIGLIAGTVGFILGSL